MGMTITQMMSVLVGAKFILERAATVFKSMHQMVLLKQQHSPKDGGAVHRSQPSFKICQRNGAFGFHQSLQHQQAHSRWPHVFRFKSFFCSHCVKEFQPLILLFSKK